MNSVAETKLEKLGFSSGTVTDTGIFFTHPHKCLILNIYESSWKLQKYRGDRRRPLGWYTIASGKTDDKKKMIHQIAKAIK